MCPSPLIPFHTVGCVDWGQGSDRSKSAKKSLLTRHIERNVALTCSLWHHIHKMAWGLTDETRWTGRRKVDASGVHRETGCATINYLNKDGLRPDNISPAYGLTRHIGPRTLVTHTPLQERGRLICVRLDIDRSHIHPKESQ